MTKKLGVRKHYKTFLHHKAKANNIELIFFSTPRFAIRSFYEESFSVKSFYFHPKQSIQPKFWMNYSPVLIILKPAPIPTFISLIIGLGFFVSLMSTYVCFFNKYTNCTIYCNCTIHCWFSYIYFNL